MITPSMLARMPSAQKIKTPMEILGDNVVQAIRQLAEKPTPAPVVNVSPAPAPQVTVTSPGKAPIAYELTVKRGESGLIESIIARPIAEGNA